MEKTAIIIGASSGMENLLPKFYQKTVMPLD